MSIPWDTLILIVIKWLMENSEVGKPPRIREWILDEVKDRDAFVYIGLWGELPEGPDALDEWLAEKWADIQRFFKKPLVVIREENCFAQRDMALSWLASREQESPDDITVCVKFDDVSAIEDVWGLIEEAVKARIKT